MPRTSKTQSSRSAGRSKTAASRKSSPKARTAGKSGRLAGATQDARRSPAAKGALSKTIQRAKWILAPDEHEDRAGQSLVTREPEVIRAWAQKRGAIPATTSNIKQGARPRVLRFDFPGFGGKTLKHISWEDWLATFEDRDLVFIFQEHKADGSESNFFRLDSPDR